MVFDCRQVVPCGGGGVWLNDGIDPDEFMLHYILVDQVICMVLHFGEGALMAKFDVEAVYHNISVHPAHCFLLGTCALPLRSSV